MWAYKYLLYPCLTSACGTPSGGWQRSNTSWSNATSLPCGSSSKFFLRSEGGRKDGERHNQLGYLLELVRFKWNTFIHKTWPGDVSIFSTLEMSTHGLAEHVALQLAPKPHRDRWHQPCCLLQAAWLVQRCLSAARGARHQAKAIALPLTPPLPPTLPSPASASLQLPSVWGLGAATRKQSPEAPGQELLQAWLTAWAFTLCLIEYSYCCTKSCYTFAVNYTGKSGNAHFLQGEINAGLFASDELIAGGLAQIWCVHPGFWLRAKQCVIALRGGEGAAVRPRWIPLNRCWACPDQSYWEKR